MKKVKKAKTDPDPLPDNVEALEGRPEALNLVTIYCALTGSAPEAVLAEQAGKGFGAFKPLLGEALVETLAPISSRFRALLDDREAIDAALARGAALARERAAPTLSATYEALGLVRG
jgi:tryptophanyl-tRNA synthetase